MRVRVYDKQTDTYFISEVYAIINSGYYTKYLVVQTIEGCRYFKLFEYLDKTQESTHLPVNINIISQNELPETWIAKEEAELIYLNNELGVKNRNDSIYSYRGYGCL